MRIRVEQDDVVITGVFRARLCRLAVAVTAPVWFCREKADVRWRRQPLARADATSTIHHDHFVRSRADHFANLLDQEPDEEKGVVTDRYDTYRPWHIFDVLPRSEHRLKNLPSLRPDKTSARLFSSIYAPSLTQRKFVHGPTLTFISSRRSRTPFSGKCWSSCLPPAPTPPITRASTHAMTDS